MWRTTTLLLDPGPQGSMLCNLETVPILVAVSISPDGCFILCSQFLFSASPSYRRTAPTTCLFCQKSSEPFEKQMNKIRMSPMASKGSCALAVNHLDWYHRFQSNLEIRSLSNLLPSLRAFACDISSVLSAPPSPFPPVGRLWVFPGKAMSTGRTLAMGTRYRISQYYPLPWCPCSLPYSRSPCLPRFWWIQ